MHTRARHSSPVHVLTCAQQCSMGSGTQYQLAASRQSTCHRHAAGRTWNEPPHTHTKEMLVWIRCLVSCGGLSLWGLELGLVLRLGLGLVWGRLFWAGGWGLGAGGWGGAGAGGFCRLVPGAWVWGSLEPGPGAWVWELAWEAKNCIFPRKIVKNCEKNVKKL